jgi:LacI family transcriptional regulator, repressor for deo operon, udp, cdd, tsx, nupC, and nupG
MITIKHIARRLDISVSTVGRALTDHPRISSTTKQRVRLAADELGYVANAAARAMRSGHSHLIGLLVPDIRSSFYSMVAHVLSKHLEAKGFHVVLSITDDDSDIELQHVRELTGARVAGIVIVPCARPRRETFALIKRVPHAQILRRIPDLGDWFGMDDESAIFEAANHLLDMGHDRIGYIGDIIFPTGKARLRGFRRAFARLDRRIDEILVQLGPADAPFGAEATRRLLEARHPPTALIATSVLATLGSVEMLTALEVDVPSRLSVIGFGDGPWQKWWGPGLTTIRLPVEEIASECAFWLSAQLKGQGAKRQPKAQAVVCRTALVCRGSTAPPQASQRQTR